MKQLMLFLFVTLSFQVVAQESTYRALVEDGKHWTYDNFLDGRSDEYNYFYEYYLQGDTVIDGKECLKMYSENENNDGQTLYKGALFEEQKKVYLINPKGRKGMLYDFDCKEGDVVTVSEGKLRVVRIYTQQNENRQLRKYELEPCGDEENTEGEELHVFWIEGVGCTKDFFCMIPLLGNYASIVSCKSKEETLYQYVQPKYTAEGYHEMAIEGKTWNYIHHFVDEEGEHNEPYSYVIKGDTVINRTICKKLFYQDKDCERYVCAILETGRDVYKLYEGETSWTIPYQFGRDDVGRVFDWESHYGRGRVFWMLNKIDTVRVKGQEFRRLSFLQKTIQGGYSGQLSTIEDDEDVWHEIWIEGVGSQISGIEDPIHEDTAQNEDYTYFVSCYENGQCIFTTQDFTANIKNPAHLNHGTFHSPCFDLLGRRLATPPAKGMYIENGRKIIK